MIRWWGVMVIAITLGLIWFFTWFFSDAWIENLLEEQASSLNGAVVEIDDFYYSIFSGTVALQRLQVTDPGNTMYNIFETGKMQFAVDIVPLFSGRFICNAASIEELRTYTKRSNDGALPPDLPRAENEEPGFFSAMTTSLGEEIGDLADPLIPDVGKDLSTDAILNEFDFQSKAKIDSLRRVYESSYAAWQQRIEDVDIDREIKDIDAQIKRVDINNLNTPDKIKDALQAASSIKGKIVRLNRKYETLRRQAESDLNLLTNDFGQVQQWIDTDYKRALRLAQVPDLQLDNISRLLFGAEYAGYLQQALHYLGMARTYLDNDESIAEEAPEPERFAGQDIEFVKSGELPDWWIKEATLSGWFGDDLRLSGKLTNLVSQQYLTGKSTRFVLDGETSTGMFAALTGDLNYLDSIPNETLMVEAGGLSLAGLELSKSPYFPVSSSRGSAGLNANLTLLGSSLNGNMELLAEQLQLSLAEGKVSNERYRRLLLNALRSITSFRIDASVSGDEGALQWSLNSDIDKRLRSAFSQSLAMEVEQVRKEIEAAVNKEVGQTRAQLQKEVDKYSKDINLQLKEMGLQISEENEAVAKLRKEIEGVVGDQTKDLEKKIKDLLPF
jgi:uncharacterized protein (TIGR03545 family)